MPTINEIKARLQRLNRDASAPRDIWKPREKHDVRLLEYPFSDDPLVSLYFHYDVGEDGPILCPAKNHGEQCAIDDFCKRLRSFNNPDGSRKSDSDRETDFELFKKIQPKARVFVPMVERGKESEGPKFWSITPKQAESIIEICLDGDRLSECGVDPKTSDSKAALRVVCDPRKAYDLEVRSVKPGQDGNTGQFPQVRISGKIKTSALAPSEDARQAILSRVKDISEVYARPSSADVELALKKFAGRSGPTASAGGGEEKKYPANSRERADRGGPRQKTKTIDEAFSEIADEEASAS